MDTHSEFFIPPLAADRNWPRRKVVAANLNERRMALAPKPRQYAIDRIISHAARTSRMKYL
jgi:hypothetical protein